LDEAVRAERAAAVLFTEEITDLDEATLLDVFADAPSTDLPRSVLDPGLSIVEALRRTDLVPSNSAARRTVEQGGAYVNNRKVDDADAVITPTSLLHDRYVVLRRGRKDQRVLRFV
jgi:tyrosyl-tRNA synthetase